MAGSAFEVALGAVARLVGGAHRVVGAEPAQVEGAAQVGVEVAALLDEAAQGALSFFGRLVDPLPDRAQLRQALLHRAGQAAHALGRSQHRGGDDQALAGLDHAQPGFVKFALDLAHGWLAPLTFASWARGRRGPPAAGG